MKQSPKVSTGVAILVIVLVLAIVGYIGYRYVWAPPQRGSVKVHTREFFQPAMPSQPTQQGGSASDVYGGARVVRPGGQ